VNKPSEILDQNFGRLSLVDESAYSAEVPWNRDLHIQLLIHIDGEDHRQCIENAWGVFLAVRKNEMELLSQGVDAAGVSKLAMDEFLDNELVERVIEILPNGEGRLVYFLFMLGRFTVEFSRDALFTEAFAMPG
jgi:hypothetical protein